MRISPSEFDDSALDDLWFKRVVGGAVVCYRCLAEREAQTDEWINRQEALRLLERFRAGEPGVEWRHLWVLIVFSLWYRIYVEHAYDPVALGWGRTARVSR